MNPRQAAPVHQVDALKMMALIDAERLACQHPGETVVVHARTAPPAAGAWTTRDSLAAFTVLPADKPTPEGTILLTTVTH